MAVSLVPVFTMPAFAQTTKREDWNGNQNTPNMIPKMNEGDNLISVGWQNVDNFIQQTAYKTDNEGFKDKITIRARTINDDIGNEDFTGGVYWRIDFSDEDKVKINKGDILLSAKAVYWMQAASTHSLSLRPEFFDAQDNLLDDSHKKTYKDHHTLQADITLWYNNIRIPKNTAYAKIWFSNWGTLGGRPFIGDFNVFLTDKTAPAVAAEPYLYAVNGNTAMPAYAMPGDKVTYAMRFDEAVDVSSKPTLNLSTGNRVGYDITYSSDRQTVYFTTTLSNTGSNADLKLKSISGLSVKDDAGNLFDYSKSNLSVGNLLYKSVFDVTNRLTNLSSSGARTAKFGSDYSAVLTPAAGYRVPENISVKVGGTAISGYTYSAGSILIAADEIIGDIEISAAALPQTYTVTFDMQGGTGGTKSAEATYLQAMPAVTPPSRKGYTFGGYFSKADGNGVQYYNYDGKAIKNYDQTANITLYAKWSAKEYTVTLDAMGGTGGGTVTAVYDAAMPAIEKPTKKGYAFLGYFTQQNGGGEKYYNADGTSAKRYDKTDGLMLYADWSAKTYTVSFDMQGGMGGTQNAGVTYDAKMPPVVPPTREGYTFGGYFEKANGAGAQYYYADGEAAKNYDIDAPSTFYAKWTANTYNVVLNTQGGSGGSTITAVFASDMPVIAAPDKPGYLFGGYFESPNGGGTKYYNADCSSARVYDKAQGITLYALWTPITYNIQLYSRGENVGTLRDVVYGELCLPSDTALGISYQNYNFVGWNMYDEQNWAMYTADRTYAAGLATEQGKTVYIYAAWLEKDKYTLTYDANGGEGAPPAVEVHTNETVILSAAVPARQNYTFCGWSEKSDSAAAQYQPNDSFTMGDSIVTLFAVWSKNPELVYDANGGVFNSYAAASYPPAGSRVKLTDAVPQKEGFLFCGWAESETAAKADIVSSPYTMPNHDTVLYAVYEPVLYTVSVFAADGYTVSGIDARGYVLGGYAEFTVSGAAPKVYINGIPVQPTNGKYRFEVQNNASVVVSDASGINVIYNANGGVNPPVDMRTYANGDMAVVKTDVPARTGYTFLGWATAQDLGYAEYTGGERIPVSAEDIVLYAVWEAASYTIRYDANGGSGSMAATAAVYDKEIALAKNTFTKTGCRFDGWSYTSGGGIAYADGANVKNLTDVRGGEITLYAVWSGAKTKVNFNFEGGTSGTAYCEVSYGNILPEGRLTAPYRYGYTFAGYYTSANKGGTLVYNADMSLSESYRNAPWDSVAEEFELYAAWEPITYTVAFVNGTQTLGTVSAVYGDVFSLPKAETLGVSVPAGYAFCGWSVASGSDTVYYRDGQEIATGLTGENGTVVYLYAVIQKNESFTVTLPGSQEGYKVYYNDVEITAQKDIIVSKGEDISFAVRVEDGYTPDKMTVLANGIMLGAVQADGSKYTYNIKHVSADTSVNIYHVRKETFRVILHDGTGYSILPKNTVVESGADFSFDVTPADGYKTSVPVVFANGSTLSGTKNGDVYTYTVCGITSQPVISVSVAKMPQHTVTFISNGSIYSIAAVEENMRALQPSTPERNGYTFGGWYTDASCNYPYDFRTEVTDDVKLYAKWTADTYAVEYKNNTTDNVAVPSAQIKEHDNVLILSPQIPLRTGYTFAAWNTKSDGTGTSYSAGGELNVNADITLYAQWKINRFAVSLITGEGVTGALSANEAAYNETVRVTAASGDGYNSPVITAIPAENAELIEQGVYKITGPVSFVASAEARKIYTASFFLDGGLYYTQSAIEGSGAAVALPNPPAKAGHTFAGWYTAMTGGVKVDETTALDRDLSVYARFDADLMTVTPAPDGNGYTVDSEDSTTVQYGDDYTFTVTIADHYNADSMKVYANGILLAGSESGGVYSFTVKNITVNQTIAVTGVELDRHTITYMVDGQVYLTVQSDYNASLAEPISPAKNGETFRGWSDGNRIWNFATDKVTSDMTLHAVWESGTLTVTPAPDGNGYTVDSEDSTTVQYGDDYTFTVTIAEHYSADSMKVYANGVRLMPKVYGNVYEFTVKNITDDVTITVCDVTAEIYTVRYIVDGEVYYSERVAYNAKAQKPKSPSKTGHVFAGWFADGEEWNFADWVEDNLELEAKFDTLMYSITVPENKSEFTVNITSADTAEYGGNFAFSITVSDGYDAADMAVYANGVLLEKTAQNGNTVYFEIADVTEAKVITVRGIGRNTYSVSYNKNTAEYVGNMPDPEIKAYDADVTVSDLTPERYGYTFLGWSEQKDGHAQYFAGDTYSDNSDITLYAVWEPKKFSVEFETNGGIINNGEIAEYAYGTGAVLPADVSKSGYDFAGWYEDEHLQGARVYEIKKSDFGDKKYYAAYTMANVTVNGYSGEYDGKTHNISYTLADNLTVEKYQWYFVPDGSGEAAAVSSDSYNTYAVKDVVQSGEYYCYVEALLDNYVIRFFTQRATVSIGKRPVSVKAADGAKVYDAQPLAVNDAKPDAEGGLIDGDKITVFMTAESKITDVGTAENKIERIVILDSANADVTANYEITAQSGVLKVTPLTLTAAPKNISVGIGTALRENMLYEISGMLGNELLSLKNVSVSAKDANNADVPFADITKKAGIYTVEISYTGFDGDGSENYQGDGTLTATVTVYRRSGGGSGGGSSSGSGGGGGGMITPTYTVSFDTNGGGRIETQSVKSGGKAKEPEAPEMEGYTFDGWYSDGALTEKFDFTADITQNITLYAKWTESKQNQEQKPENPSVADPSATGVAKLLETEEHISYLKGYSNGKFKPERNMTRAEAAQMFYNLLLDKNISGTGAFNDVKRGAWYYDAVTALAGMGIIKGVGANRFKPDGEITRAEFVTIAMRFVSIDAKGTETFADVGKKHWAAKNIADAASLGWISGNSDGTFSPDAPIKRNSVVKIVNNMLGRKADMKYVQIHADSIKLFGDVSPSEWYYQDVIEATNAHKYEKDNGTEIWK